MVNIVEQSFLHSNVMQSLAWEHEANRMDFAARGQGSSGIGTSPRMMAMIPPAALKLLTTYRGEFADHVKGLDLRAI